jgi:hypothetical protein
MYKWICVLSLTLFPVALYAETYDEWVAAYGNTVIEPDGSRTLMTRERYDDAVRRSRGVRQQSASPVVMLADLQQERARFAAAEAVAFTEPAAPEPAPAPPVPGESCMNCNGTGRSGDGLSPCRVCGGDGKLMIMDAVRYTDNQTGSILAKLSSIESSLAKALTRSEFDQTCGPDCTCGPNCTCEYPGQCLDKKQDRKSYLDPPTTITAARADSMRLRRPALLYITDETCAPCQVFQETRLEAAPVHQLITERFVLAIIDVDNVTADERRHWSIATVPKLIVVNAEWNRRALLDNVTAESVESLLVRLRTQLQWAERKLASDEPPIEAVAQWFAAPSYGSAGGYPQMGYGSAGGVSYGSAGGGAQYYQPSYSYPAQYSRPAYYYPSYRYAPVRSWAAGAAVVCGPGGCFIQ